MNKFLESFSTREISLLIWLGLFIIFLLSKKDTRKSIGGIFKALFAKSLLRILIGLTIYVCIIVYFFYKLHFLEVSALKDTIFWFFGVAIILFFKVDKAKDVTYFKRIIKETFKWTIALEFLVNLYTFSLTAELIAMPIIVLIAATKAFADVKKDEKVNKFLENVLTFIGFIVIGIVLYKSVVNYRTLLSMENLKSILFTPILTILFVPLIYLIALFMSYETLFIRIDFITKDSQLKKGIKGEIVKIANLNLNRVNRIANNILKVEVYKTDDLKEYIKSIS